MRLLLITAFLLSCVESICQEKPYKAILDSNLSVTFSEIPETVHEKEMKVFKVATDSLIYQVIINYSIPLKVKNKKDFDIAVQGIIAGVNKTPFIDSFTQKVVDTIIDKVPGKYMTLYNAKGINGIYEMTNFITIIDSYTYMVTTMVGALNKMKADSLKREFYNSVRFSGSPYQINEQSSSVFLLGKMIGKYVIPALVIIAIVTLINLRRRKYKNS
jgi:hypothetical protein